MKDEEKLEWLICAESPLYFANTYGQIYDAAEGGWIPFDLWPAQARTLKVMQTHPLTVILKARQLGLTWLCLAYALWQMLFHPQAEILLFSRRDDEAVHLLDERLKGMYNRLPDWMKAREITRSNSHEFGLSNGSTARAFPTSAGDSYTATLAIIDEADLVPDFNRLMRAVKPTIDTGGRMVLLSRTDKTTPESEFKRIYRAAKSGKSPWVNVFLPWFVRPARDATWYEEQKQDIFSRTGALDDLHEQYPATDTEALSPRSLDKRIPPMWIEACYEEIAPLRLLADGSWLLAGEADSGQQLTANSQQPPAIPDLIIYSYPREFAAYVIGADPAEGNPTSDDSALTVMDYLTGEEVAALAGKFEPSTLAAHIASISAYFNDAPAMVERNNHGHAVIGWIADNAPSVLLLDGHDGKRGWMSSTLGKALLYTECADHFRQNALLANSGEKIENRNWESASLPLSSTSYLPSPKPGKILHNFSSYTQLASIEGATLRAPKGQFDDRADSYALAHVGRAASVDTVGMHQAPIRNRSSAPIVRKGFRHLKSGSHSRI